MDLLLPNIADKVHTIRIRKKLTHYYHARDRQLQIDDSVLAAKKHVQGPPWIPGKTLKQSGAVTFLVELTNGTIVHHQLDQLKLSMTMTTKPSERKPATTPFLITFNHLLYLN